MQASELVKLAQELHWIFEEKGIVQRYSTLAEALRNVAQSPTLVGEAHDSIVEIQRRFEEVPLSPSQRTFIEGLGGAGLLGIAAVQALEQIFNTNRTNPTAAAKAVTVVSNDLSALAGRVSHLIQALKDFKWEEETPTALGPGEGLLWLRFEDAADVLTVGDLEKAAAEWRSILHHFSRLSASPVAEGRIDYIQKYSPLEVQLVASLSILLPLGFGITYVLKRVEQFIGILKKAEELKQMRVKTEVIKLLLDDAREQRKKLLDDAADAVQQEFSAAPEARNAVRLGLGKVLKFIEKGGLVDVDVPEETPRDQPDSTNADAPVTGVIQGKVAVKPMIESLRRAMKEIEAVGLDPSKLLAEHSEADEAETPPATPADDESDDETSRG